MRALLSAHKLQTAVGGLAYQARVARVLAATQLKLKYEDAVLGYFW